MDFYIGNLNSILSYIPSKLMDSPSYSCYFVFQANMYFFSEMPGLFNAKEDFLFKLLIHHKIGNV